MTGGAEGSDGAHAPPRSGGATLAMIEGRSGRAVIANTIRDLAQIPAFIRACLSHRDGGSWVFGNIHGFRDNPRYLAEYILHHRPDIGVTWIAQDDEEAQAVRSAGLKVTLRGLPDARRVQRHAGVAVLTHGFRDLDLQHLGGARLVFVWHGTPLKRIALDVRVGARRRSFARIASHIVRFAHRRSFGLVSMFVASGQLEQRRLITAFAASVRRVPNIGSPRFDVIRGGSEYDLIVHGDLRAQLGYGPHDWIVLWLPTHRLEYGDERWLPRLTDEDVERTFGGTDIKLLVKPHPRADWDVFRDRLPTNGPRVRLLPVTDVDVNCLLHVADALISDYSSVVCDYAILNRPIYFLAPDVDTYADNRGLYDPYETLTDNRHHSDWPSLLTAIRADMESPEGGEGRYLVERMNAYLSLNTEADASGRIVDAIVALRGKSKR